jgi:hypothetical protein
MSRTDNQPDELTDASPNLPGSGQQTYAWIAECTDDLDAPESVSLADDDASLTAADIKMIRNTAISAISHNADVAAWLAAGIRAVLADAGVLTERNVHESAGLYARLDETIYGTVFKVLREAGLAK